MNTQQPPQYSPAGVPNEPPPPYTPYPQAQQVLMPTQPVQMVPTGVCPQTNHDEEERQRRRRMMGVSLGLHAAGVPHAGLIGMGMRIISRMGSNEHSDEPRPSRAERRAHRKEERAERRERRRMERGRSC